MFKCNMLVEFIYLFIFSNSLFVSFACSVNSWIFSGKSLIYFSFKSKSKIKWKIQLNILSLFLHRKKRKKIFIQYSNKSDSKEWKDLRLKREIYELLRVGMTFSKNSVNFLDSWKMIKQNALMNKMTLWVC